MSKPSSKPKAIVPGRPLPAAPVTPITVIYQITGTHGLFSKRPTKLSFHTFGYLLAKKDALKAVRRNVGEMHECLYDHLVISATRPGVYGSTIGAKHYRWQPKTRSWKPCACPQKAKCIEGWTTPL